MIKRKTVKVKVVYRLFFLMLTRIKEKNTSTFKQI